LQPALIKVGNLEAKRDFTDVRDIVSAYWLATEKCQPGDVYNISAGNCYSIQEVLAKLISLSTVKDIQVVKDMARLRPSDVPILQGDSSKFRAATGWQPKIDYLNQTVEDMLNYWRERV